MTTREQVFATDIKLEASWGTGSSPSPGAPPASGFRVGWRAAGGGGLIAVSHGFSAGIGGAFILARGLGAGLSFHGAGTLS